MSDKNEIIVKKIKQYIQETQSYVSGMDFNEFMESRKTISATAFTVSQIGELSNKIDTQFRKAYPTIPWRELRGMRNRIVHDYENVDYGMLWQTITEDFTGLLRQFDDI